MVLNSNSILVNKEARNLGYAWVHHSTIDYVLKKYAGSLAVKTGAVYRVSPHSMRASVATSLLKSGESLDSVQRLLNHSNVSTTQKYDRRKHEISDSVALKVKFFEGKK